MFSKPSLNCPWKRYITVIPNRFPPSIATSSPSTMNLHPYILGIYIGLQRNRKTYCYNMLFCWKTEVWFIQFSIFYMQLFMMTQVKSIRYTHCIMHTEWLSGTAATKGGASLEKFPVEIQSFASNKWNRKVYQNIIFSLAIPQNYTIIISVIPMIMFGICPWYVLTSKYYSPRFRWVYDVLVFRYVGLARQPLRCIFRTVYVL